MRGRAEQVSPKPRTEGQRDEGLEAEGTGALERAHSAPGVPTGAFTESEHNSSREAGSLGSQGDNSNLK